MVGRQEKIKVPSAIKGKKQNQLAHSKGGPDDFKLSLTPCWLETWEVGTVLNRDNGPGA